MLKLVSRVFVAMGFFVTAATLSAAESKNPAFTDPQQAGPDFVVQGEYEGTLNGDKTGAQIIALGDGKFDLVGYHGGLPGDGWKKGDSAEKATGETKGDVTRFTGEKANATLENGVLTVTKNGEVIGTLNKVERTSPTLGAQPPTGASVLFDGSSADNFENGQLVEGDLLAASNCASKQKFGDHSGHLEFRTPFMPQARGQGRGNSGLYLQSRYELQILDSFGLEGKNNECGGIYSISEPLVNMCFPPLSWQTYDYDFTAARYDDDGNKVQNARATIRHNGVVIHDDLELTHGTPGRFGEGPGPEAVFLQNHGNPVVFRNIWVLAKK